MGTKGQAEDQQCAVTAQLAQLWGKLELDSSIHIPTDAGETHTSLNLSQPRPLL